MNQILFNKKIDKKKKYIYKVQFFLSIILATIILLTISNNYSEEKNLENISKSIDKKIELLSIYNTSPINTSKKMYFGKIVVDKLSLEYSIFNEYNEELLKIAPCKFYGPNLGEKGNICIAGHNYNDKRFFGKIDELEIKDIIKLVDLNNKEYEYIIYDIFETSEEDLSILKSNKNYELTLLTCNNSNSKRIIIKSYMKEY